MKRGFLFTAIALVALLAIASCGGGATGQTGGANTISVKMSEMKFDPATYTVPANQQITVTAQNTGAAVHDFTTKGLGQEVKLVVQPGQTGSATFTAAKAGTYEVVCTQPGHEAAGMKGTLTVK